MLETVQAQPASNAATSVPEVIISTDSHMSPLMSDLSEYCPAKFREQFDEWDAQDRTKRDAQMKERESAMGLAVLRENDPDLPPEIAERVANTFQRLARQSLVPGNSDVHARLRDMDVDGVAAEVIFHGAHNNEPIPFVGLGLTMDIAGADHDLATLGYQIYNRFLADAVSVAPYRLLGLAHLPFWDMDAALQELKWARGAGLRAVNFTAPRPQIPVFDDPAWEPFWSACEALQMTLTTHQGAGDFPVPYHTQAVGVLELGWLARRGLAPMIFGGVFERHPELKLVYTEMHPNWWPEYARHFSWPADGENSGGTSSFPVPLPKKPIQYMETNVFAAASQYLTSFRAAEAVAGGYAANVMWGRDYPHVEGSYQLPDHDDDPPTTPVVLRRAFAGIPPREARLMVGETAGRVYGFDTDALATVAEEINAPTLDELTAPLSDTELALLPLRPHDAVWRTRRGS